MKECPKCKSSDKVKNGKNKGLQRYLCKECGYNYSVVLRKGTYAMSVKKQALHLYLEGIGFRSIGRILKVSNVSVLNWIRSFGKELTHVNNSSKVVQVMELDEMHTYIHQKKTIVGFGLLLIDMENNTSILALEQED
jgi:transposase-like protein